MIFAAMLVALAAQQNPPTFGKASRIPWIDGVEKVVAETPDPRTARDLAGKKYLFVYVKPPADVAEPNVFMSIEVVAASRGAWAFAVTDFSKESALQKSWGVTSAPAIVGCDLHGNEFMRTTDFSLGSIRRVLVGVPDAIQKYDTKLKADYAKGVDAVSADPRKAIRPFVDVVQQGRPGYKEVKEALQILTDLAKEDGKRSDLAESLGADEGIAALEETVKLYKSTPPGVRAEFRIAELELQRGNYQAAVQRLERILKHDLRFIRSEHEAAVAALEKIRRDSRGNVAELQKQHERFRAGEKILAERPDDPAANLEVGRFLCLARGEWEKGLPLLAKGADAALKALAGKDLAAPAGGAERAQLGDLWWEQGEAFRVRACHWYERALETLTGLSRMKIEKRLEESAALRPGVDLLKLIDPKLDAPAGDWFVEEGGLTSQGRRSRETISIPYAPPEEYVLRVVAERRQGNNMLAIGVGSGPSRAAILLGYVQGGRAISGISLIDGKQGNANESTREGEVFAAGKHAVIVCTVRKSGIAVEVDGKAVIDWKGDAARLSLNPVWRVPADRSLFLGAGDTCFHISRAVLTPLSGQGKKLR